MLNTEYYYNKYYSSFHIQYLFLNEYLIAFYNYNYTI